MATDSMTVKINPNDKGNPAGQHFGLLLASRFRHILLGVSGSGPAVVKRCEVL
jgi:hypothetical protein